MWNYVKEHWFFVIFWVITAVTGLIVSWFATGIYYGIRAESWTPTPCTIRSSQNVAVSRKGSRFHIVYEYVVNGVTYRSSRYQFLTSSSKGRPPIPIELRAGKLATCYVDPADPSEAVLERGIFVDVLFGLFPLLLFLLFGLLTVASIFDMVRSVAGWIRRLESHPPTPAKPAQATP
jgi:hypothetical protein